MYRLLDRSDGVNWRGWTGLSRAMSNIFITGEGNSTKDHDWEEMVGVEEEHTPVDSERAKIYRHHPSIVRKISLIVKPP